jgi:hypothetical protein
MQLQGGDECYHQYDGEQCERASVNVLAWFSLAGVDYRTGRKGGHRSSDCYRRGLGTGRIGEPPCSATSAAQQTAYESQSNPEQWYREEADRDTAEGIAHFACR